MGLGLVVARELGTQVEDRDLEEAARLAGGDVQVGAGVAGDPRRLVQRLGDGRDEAVLAGGPGPDRAHGAGILAALETDRVVGLVGGDGVRGRAEGLGPGPRLGGEAVRRPVEHLVAGFGWGPGCGLVPGALIVLVVDGVQLVADGRARSGANQGTRA